MELSTTSALDLKVTKEDLIDIIIDEQLTVIEDKLDVLDKSRKKCQAEIQVYTDRNDQALRKRLMKSLPTELKGAGTPTLSFTRDQKEVTVYFNFPTFQVGVYSVNTQAVKDPKGDAACAVLRKTLDSLSTEISNLREDKRQLEGNNKRIKAKMIKNFLTQTEKGKAILATLGQPSAKLLSISAK